MIQQEHGRAAFVALLSAAVSQTRPLEPAPGKAGGEGRVPAPDLDTARQHAEGTSA